MPGPRGFTGERNDRQLKHEDGPRRGRRETDERETKLLPSLSASDVACCAELSFSGILGCSGTVDLRQAERRGREDWQESERRDLWREPVCARTEWQDRGVSRHSSISQLFSSSRVEHVACSCQADKKCHVGWYFCLFVFFLPEKKQGLKGANRNSYHPFPAPSSTQFRCGNNDQHQQASTCNLVTKQKRTKEEKKEPWEREKKHAMEMAEETGLEEDWNSLWRSMTKTLIAEGQRCGPLLCVCVCVFAEFNVWLFLSLFSI